MNGNHARPFHVGLRTLVKIVAVPSTDSATRQAIAAGQHFLDRYVERDGRVVRRDQGGDTVSEGQAYGMLIAVATGSKGQFEDIWNWSKANLLQSDGLMAWQWKDGKVVDRQPATDADLDAARALALAATRFNDPGLADDARNLARAIADRDVFYPADGAPVLMAGPWATQGQLFVNPSYHSPRTEQLLSTLTTDTRWASMETRQRALIDSLIGTGKNVLLPPDWALLDPSGSIQPSGAPQKSGDPQYSYDAFRMPVRLAESCNPADREQAARLWPLLGKSKTTKSAVTFSLQGEVKNPSPTAEGSVAAAAVAHARGDEKSAAQLLKNADQIVEENDTYYASAWAALGRIMLTTTLTGDCT
jgi:endoglucanase